jgi:hypothetical protein
MSEALAWALENARHQTLALVADLNDEQMCQQTTPGEHHPAWILGHLLLGDVYLLALLKVEDLPDDFPGLLQTYGPGATPTPTWERYPSKEFLTERLTASGSRRLAAVRAMTSAALKRPTPDPLLVTAQPTIGHHLHALVFHEGYHGGQLSSWRHAKRLPPIRWTLAESG